MKKKNKISYLLIALMMLCISLGTTKNVYAANAKINWATFFDGSTIAGAIPITIGNKIQGSITEDQEWNYYSFSLKGAGCVTLNMTSYMKYYCIEIYDEDGDRIWYTDENVWNSTIGYLKKTHNIYLEKGDYYIQVSGYLHYDSYHDWYKSTGTYSCETSFKSSNVTNVEDDNSVKNANQVTLGKTIVGQISENDDFDTYKITLSKASCIKWDMTSWMKYYCVKLFDEEGNEIWYTDENKLNSNVGYRKDSYDWYLARGTYYMQVNGYRYSTYDKSTGKYELKNQCTATNVSFEEDDNSFPTANTVKENQEYKGQVSINDDYNTYKFDVKSDRTIEIDITSYMQYYCIKLYNKEGNEIWYTDWNEWNDNVKYRQDNHKITLSKGTYYMQVNGYHYSTYYKSTGAYTFKLSNLVTKPHKHQYTSKITKATLNSNGKIEQKCSCGAVSSTKTIYRPTRIALSSTRYTYNGKTKKPAVTVKGSNGATISKSNYTVSYAKGRKNVGIYKVTIKFKGNYSGTVTRTFSIIPKGTSITKLSQKKKGFTVAWKKQTSQVSGYEICCSSNPKFTNSVMRLAQNAKKTKITCTGLRSNKVYYVSIRTYKKVGRRTYYSNWSKIKKVRVR